MCLNVFVFFKLGITFEPFLLNLTQKNHFLFQIALRKILFLLQQSVDLYKTSAWHKEDKNDQVGFFFFFFK